jgi:CDP-4-dehydro-6-deoxyglucose reductase
MPEQITHARVINTIAQTQQLLKVTLAPTPYIPYEAGQYLQVISDDHGPLYYSIANAPNPSRTYELHLRHGRDIPGNEHFILELAKSHPITLKLPYGQCTLRAFDPIRPILFIAGGTGFAPIHAMIEQLIAENQTRRIALYWSARSTDELYMDDKMRALEKEMPWFNYVSRVSKTNQASISDLVLNQHKNDIHAWQIVLAGPFDMVYSLRDDLVAQGISPHLMHSDAFAFETKP